MKTENGLIIVKTLLAEGARVPTYGSEEAAGADVRAFIKEPVTIPPGNRACIPLGLKVALPAGYEIDVRPRSGLAVKYGVTILNTPGTLDSDYRGENSVLLINFGTEPFVVNPGDRIGQWVLFKVERASFEEASALPDTKRGAGGWGSTGVQ